MAGDATRPQAVRLTDRDRAILDHLARYRLTTIEALHRLFWEPTTTANAVSQVLARLAAGGYVQRIEESLSGSQNYYLLTAEAAREYGEDEDFARPPGTTSLIHHYLMLEFCCLGDARREHITAQEIRTGFPNLNGRGIARNAYFHTFDEPPRLGWLEVDCGNHAETRAKKCRKQFAKRYEAQELRFRELADEGRFGIVLVTTSEGKKRALERALAKLDYFPLSIVVSATLRELLGRMTRPRPGEGADRAREDAGDTTADEDDL